jgi:hypothetical protein
MNFILSKPTKRAKLTKKLNKPRMGGGGKQTTPTKKAVTSSDIFMKIAGEERKWRITSKQ